jgi:hypothetical protein
MDNSVFSPSPNDVFTTAAESRSLNPHDVMFPSEAQLPAQQLASQIERILSDPRLASSSSSLRPPAPPRPALSSEEILAPSPIHPLRSAVNMKRGRKQLGGPALSLFQFEQGRNSTMQHSAAPPGSGPTTSKPAILPSSLQPPAATRAVLSSEEILPPSPLVRPLRSKVNLERGKRELGGPALSLFQFEQGSQPYRRQALLPGQLVVEEKEEEDGESDQLSVSGSSAASCCSKANNRRNISASSTDSDRLTSPAYGSGSGSGRRHGSSAPTLSRSSEEDIIIGPTPPQSSRSISRSLQSHKQAASCTSRIRDVSSYSINSLAATSSRSVPPESTTGFQSEQNHLEDFTITMGCVCGIPEYGDSYIVRCDACQQFFHTSCVGIKDEDMAALEEVDEWLCPLCLPLVDESVIPDDRGEATKDKSRLSLSFSEEDVDKEANEVTSARGTAGSLCRDHNHDAESMQSELINGSVLLPGEEDCLQAKPGKNWRRSLSMSLAASNYSSLPGRDSIADLFPRLSLKPVNKEFLAPLPVPAARRSSKRVSARRSTLCPPGRASLLHPPPAVIEEEDEESEDAAAARDPLPVHAIGKSLQNMNLSLVSQKKRSSRSSFYLVSGPVPAGGVTPLPDVSVLLEPELSPLDKLKAQCWGRKIVQFSDAYPDEILADSRKVGEGTFGEVYLLGVSAADRPVLKIVPVGGEVKVNDEEQAGLSEMLSEVVISNTLSSLRRGGLNHTEGKGILGLLSLSVILSQSSVED